MFSIVILCLKTLLILQNAVKGVIINTTVCFQDTVEYIYIEGQQTFDDAIEACEEEDSVLVKIDTEEKFVFIQNFSLSIVDSDFWLGLRRDSGTNAFSPQSFFFLDGTAIDVDGFGGTNGEFPWITNQPNGAEEECVLVENNLTEWQDNDCESVRRVVCERPCGSALIEEKEEMVLFNLKEYFLGLFVILFVVLLVVSFVYIKQKQKLNRLTTLKLKENQEEVTINQTTTINTNSLQMVEF